MITKINEFLDKYIDRLKPTPVSETPPILDPTDVYKSILYFRDHFDLVDLKLNTYSHLDLCHLSLPQIKTYELKQRLDVKNVTDKERRLITLKAAFYRYSNVPKDLLLIDAETVGIFNFFGSLMEMEVIDSERLGSKQTVDKNQQYAQENMAKFANMVHIYEQDLALDRLKPLEFFVHDYIFQTDNIIAPNRELYNETEFLITHFMVAYSYLYKIPIPASYVVIDRHNGTVNNIVKNLLSGILFTPADPKKIKQPILTLVKND